MAENNQDDILSMMKKILLKEAMGPYAYLNLVINMGKGRWPEAEPIILSDPEAATDYAHSIICGRWVEAEPIIMKNLNCILRYARNVLHGRWLDAEPIIMKSPPHIQRYASIIMKKRWLEAEPIIFQDANVLNDYLRRFDLNVVELIETNPLLRSVDDVSDLPLLE